MTPIHANPTFDHARPHSQQGFHASPNASPRIHRHASQQALHLAPLGPPSFAVIPEHDAAATTPLSAFPHPQPFKPYTPVGLSLPVPHHNHNFASSYPPTAPPLSYYPGTQTPLYDSRSSAPTIRTFHHVPPLHSATEHTASSRYSASPHSAGAHLHDAPASASLPNGVYNVNPPTFQVVETSQDRHIGPGSLFPGQTTTNIMPTYTMSRSTSGASASDAGHDVGRLVTPQYEYRADLAPIGENGYQYFRKVSDSGMSIDGNPRGRIYSGPGSGSALLAPNYETHHGHALGLGAHSQPEVFFRGGGYSGEHYSMSAERGESKPDVSLIGLDTEYERERQAQIMSNRQLLAEVGLAGQDHSRQRNVSSAGQRVRRKNPVQRRSAQPVRNSPRLASRTISYADMGDGNYPSDSEDEYPSENEYDDEDDFRPVKRSRGGGRGGYGGRKSHSGPKNNRRVDLSLWGLLQVYPDILHGYPLFYYTLNNDLTINSDSVPLIGSIPSTYSPMEKTDTLQMYYHRGRRVLAQIDAFNARADRKYEGPGPKWPEVEYHTRIAIRDVRRKVVERCENYKYTRRDILDKLIGKNKWQPIEHGMIEWYPGTTNNDPANDLVNITLQLPTPPPQIYSSVPTPSTASQPMQRQASQSMYPGRSIKPFPARGRYASNTPGMGMSRVMSVDMSSAGQYPAQHQQQMGTAVPMTGYSYAPPQTAMTEPPPPAMYGEDQVPMSVQMPQSAQMLPPAPHSSSYHQALSQSHSLSPHGVSPLPELPAMSDGMDASVGVGMSLGMELGTAAPAAPVASPLAPGSADETLAPSWNQEAEAEMEADGVGEQDDGAQATERTPSPAKEEEGAEAEAHDWESEE